MVQRLSCLLVICILSIVGVACESRRDTGLKQEAVSSERMAHYFEKADCSNARRYLNEFAAASRTVSWYDYQSQTELMCGETKSVSAGGSAALAVLDQGLERFPDSPRLLKAKGEIYESLGDGAQAEAHYKAAADAASARLKVGTESLDDHSVIAELRGIDQRRNSQALKVPTVDLSTRDWTLDAATLIGSGRCIEALDLLTKVRVRPVIWYELTSQAHAVCRMNGDRAGRQEAVKTITEGILKYPESIRLRLVRAVIFESIGEQQTASLYYDETARMAREAISLNSAEADQSSEILEALRKQGKISSR